MTRDELIGACVAAGVWANEGELDSMLDAAEPLIRADERQTRASDIVTSYRQGVSEYRAALRARVEALHQRLYDSRWMVDRDDVLALLDGGSDG